MWLAFLFIGIVGGYAQQTTVTGKVLDSTNEPLIGVTIQVKGTQRGTITDFEGKFSIQASPDETLVVSYIGYKTQEVSLSGMRDLTIVLTEDNEMLEEVVVIGYGTVRKKDLTGSVAQIKPDALANEAP